MDGPPTVNLMLALVALLTISCQEFRNQAEGGYRIKLIRAPPGPGTAVVAGLYASVSFPVERLINGKAGVQWSRERIHNAR